MRRFWISWIQKTEDYRPLSFPPNPGVLGWWCSGYDGEGKAIICSLVAADSLADAWKAIDSDWPREERVERFGRGVAEDFTPGDRFPLGDWMRGRIGVPKGA